MNLKSERLTIYCLAVILAVGVFFGYVDTSISANQVIRELTSPIDDGYGVSGPYSVEIIRVKNPKSKLVPKVSIFYPNGQDKPKSVIFFCHGFSAIYYSAYRDYINNMVSRGDVVVVFSPYRIRGSHAQRYEMLWNGFKTAVEKYANMLNMDTTRIGFIGHSYGGGACPRMLHHAIVDKGWGSNGSFIYAMQPWFSLEMIFERDGEQINRWPEIPSTTKVLVQVCDYDGTLDNDIAINGIWRNLGNIPKENKEYQVLLSVSNCSDCLDADHGVPCTHKLIDGFDRWGTWRRAHALISAVFDSDPVANDLVFGHGSATEVYMGTWLCDDTDVNGMITMDEPYSLNKEIAKNHWSDGVR